MNEIRCTIGAIVMFTAAALAPAQAPKHYDGPIFDVHLHTDPPDSAVGLPNPVTGAPASKNRDELRQAVLQECKKYNITHAVLHGWPDTLQSWAESNPSLFLPAPMPLRNGVHPVFTPAEFATMNQNGRAAAVGEIMGQYFGLEPADPVLEPYWAMAESLDVPVMIHTGTSFPETAYHGYPAFRLRFGNPLLLEDVLVKHPRLRLWIAHGGLPWTQETFALMDQYPNVYMDISTIDWILGEHGKQGFYDFLLAAMRHGYGKRMMFGSDEMAWPDAIGLSIRTVDAAPFLTNEQKADIFYNNAARFFRIGASDVNQGSDSKPQVRTTGAN
jgi:uncharacterized protein